MGQRANDDTPTIEPRASHEPDGAVSDRLDSTRRFRIVPANESSSGSIAFDDRGQPQWKWRCDLPANAAESTGTFDQLKALDNPDLSLEEAAVTSPKAAPSRKTGYDPYATGVFERPKTRR